MTETEIHDFLQKSHYCDVDNVMIQKTASELGRGSISQTEIAKRLFYFVRDTTVYRVGHWTQKASETLKEKGGTCTNNANLLIALLRAANIPAGYGVMEVVGPEYFGPVVLPHLARNVSAKSKHVYCHVYLDQRWVKCDPSDDEPLSINTQHLNPQSKTVAWNGISDAVLNLSPSHILSDRGPIANIDKMIAKRMKYRRWVPVYIGNIYINFLRQEGRKISSISDLSKKFDAWLIRRHFVVYIFYKLYFFFESYLIRIRGVFKI